VFGRLKQRQLGDSVTLLINPKQPYKALINTPNGRYGVTLTFAMLLLRVSVAVTIAIGRQQ